MGLQNEAGGAGKMTERGKRDDDLAVKESREVA